MSLAPIQRGEQWFEFYPVRERLRVTSPSDILLVDIGGGIGHDIAKFCAAFPDLPGRLVLQDAPAVLQQAELPSAIEAIAHDFFKPQPTQFQNAKAYYLRTVLHDWPDKQAAVILGHIRDAMSEDSVLLINESVLPESDVSLYQCKMDLNMMGSYSSLERTVAQFRKLLESCGFALAGTWRPRVMVPGSGVLLEAVVKRTLGMEGCE